MDFVFDFLHNIMPGLYILAAVLLVLKLVLVFYYKKFDLPAFIISFFKIYNKSQRNTASQRRKNFMRYNNLLNYFLYIIIALFFLMLIVFQGNMFNYQ